MRILIPSALASAAFTPTGMEVLNMRRWLPKVSRIAEAVSFAMFVLPSTRVSSTPSTLSSGFSLRCAAESPPHFAKCGGRQQRGKTAAEVVNTRICSRLTSLTFPEARRSLDLSKSVCYQNRWGQSPILSDTEADVRLAFRRSSINMCHVPTSSIWPGWARGPASKCRSPRRKDGLHPA